MVYLGIRLVFVLEEWINNLLAGAIRVLVAPKLHKFCVSARSLLASHMSASQPLPPTCFPPGSRSYDSVPLGIALLSRVVDTQGQTWSVQAHSDRCTDGDGYHRPVTVELGSDLEQPGGRGDLLSD